VVFCPANIAVAISLPIETLGTAGTKSAQGRVKQS